jgi:hypothetical protein
LDSAADVTPARPQPVVPTAANERLDRLEHKLDLILRLLDRGHSVRDRAGELLLPAVAEAVSDRAFSAAEVIRHAEVVGCSLRAALEAAGASNGRKLGKLFRELEGCEIDGLQLVRIGAERDGLVWRVLRV